MHAILTWLEIPQLELLSRVFPYLFAINITYVNAKDYIMLFKRTYNEKYFKINRIITTQTEKYLMISVHPEYMNEEDYISFFRRGNNLRLLKIVRINEGVIFMSNKKEYLYHIMSAIANNNAFLLHILINDHKNDIVFETFLELTIKYGVIECLKIIINNYYLSLCYFSPGLPFIRPDIVIKAINRRRYDIAEFLACYEERINDVCLYCGGNVEQQCIFCNVSLKQVINNRAVKNKFFVPELMAHVFVGSGMYNHLMQSVSELNEEVFKFLEFIFEKNFNPNEDYKYINFIAKHDSLRLLNLFKRHHFVFTPSNLCDLAQHNALVLIEHVLSNCTAEHLWNTKYFCDELYEIVIEKDNFYLFDMMLRADIHESYANMHFILRDVFYSKNERFLNNIKSKFSNNLEVMSHVIRISIEIEEHDELLEFENEFQQHFWPHIIKMSLTTMSFMKSKYDNNIDFYKL